VWSGYKPNCNAHEKVGQQCPAFIFALRAGDRDSDFLIFFSIEKVFFAGFELNPTALVLMFPTDLARLMPQDEQSCTRIREPHAVSWV
jgi:hypothetical protein